MSKPLNLTCPGCGEHEVREIVHPTGPGPLAGQAYFSCTMCSWFGNERALCCATEAAERREIEECLREDQQRGLPGGSSNSKGREKKTNSRGGQPNSRSEQEASPLWEDQGPRTIQDFVRDTVFGAKFTEVESSMISSAIELSGLTKSKWIQRALVGRARQEAKDFNTGREATQTS